MARVRLLGTILALSVAAAACGPGPLAEENLPDPSRREARTASYQICRTAAEEYGLERMAEYLDARSARPRAITQAFVREAIRATDGWEDHRVAGRRGCLAGLKAADL